MTKTLGAQALALILLGMAAALLSAGEPTTAAAAALVAVLFFGLSGFLRSVEPKRRGRLAPARRS